MPAARLHGNRMMSWMISRLAGQKFHDVSCGMRCYSRRAALQLHLLARFTYTQEVILNLAFKQLRIVEVPVSYRRRVGVSKITGTISGTVKASAKILWTIARFAVRSAGLRRQLLALRSTSGQA